MRRLLWISVPMLGLVACGGSVEETPPQQLSASTFHYPEELWDAGIEGETLLRVRVNEEGVVDTAVVERSSGQAGFDSAAVAGAYELRFAAAKRGEQPVEAWVLLPVQFNREGGAAEPPSTEDDAGVTP
jgi:periplasmic protein TonB